MQQTALRVPPKITLKGSGSRARWIVMPLVPIVVLMLLIPLTLTLGASFAAEVMSGAPREPRNPERDHFAPAGPAVAS
jgi:hypothetical protein